MSDTKPCLIGEQGPEVLVFDHETSRRLANATRDLIGENAALREENAQLRGQLATQQACRG